MAFTFINPMLLRRSQDLPRGDQWLYELKFDGFRGLAIKNGDDVQLLSRQQKYLTKRFTRIVDAIKQLRVIFLGASQWHPQRGAVESPALMDR